MANSTGGTVILPMTVQHDLISHLFYALPLCVANTSGLRPWINEHFIELYSTAERSGQRRTFVNFLDAFAYQDVLETVSLSPTDMLGIDSPIDYMYDRLADGWYATVFLDLNHFRGVSTPFIKELLVYGYDGAAAEMLTVGFNVRWTFGSMRLPRELFAEVFQHTQTLLAPQGPASWVRRPIQLMRPRGIDHVFDLSRLTRRLRNYLDASCPDFLDVMARGWWYQGGWEMPEDADVVFGIDIWNHLAHHVNVAMERLAGDAAAAGPEFKIANLLAEHKRGLYRRIAYLCAEGEQHSRLSAVLPRLDEFATELERLRAAALMYTFAGRTSQFSLDGVPPLLKKLHAREAALLADVLAALDSHDRM